MITLEEILRLPAMRDVVVRAGAAGLGASVRWVHIMDHPDLAYTLEGGELLLTIGQAWPREPAAEARLLESLLHKRVAGILFSVGPYISEIPRAVLEFGNRHGIAILEDRWKIFFVQVTQAVHQEMLRRQYQTLAQADQIHRELTRKAATAHNPADVCHALAHLLGRTALLIDPGGRLLAGTQPEADAPTLSVTAARQLIRATMTQAWFRQALDGWRAGQTRAVSPPGRGRPYQVVCPVQIGGEHVATLWLFDPRRNLEEIDGRAAEHAATVLALLIAREREAEATRRRLRIEFLEVLLQGPAVDRNLFAEKARLVGLEPGSPCLAGLMLAGHGDDGQAPEGWDPSPWRAAAQQWIEETPGLSGYCEAHGERLVILVSVQPDAGDPAGWLPALQRRLAGAGREEDPAPVLVLGEIKPDLWSARESYREAEALAALVGGSGSGQVYTAGQWQRQLLLYGALSPADARRLRRAILGEELLSGQGAVLYETLQVLVQHGFNQRAAARALHIHRNTLRYRIQRIEELLAEPLSTPAGQFWVRVALDLKALAAAGGETPPRRPAP